jgi:dipeptidyl aminopeptidase/acylaminoacyl peptidase
MSRRGVLKEVPLHIVARSFRALAVAAIVAACVLSARGQAQTHPVTLEDLLSVRGVGETALSPDGKTFAMTRESQIVLLPSQGGWPVTLTSTTGAKVGLSWSPDGRRIAYASQGGIWTVPAAGGPPQRLTSAAPGRGDPRHSADHTPQWSPKGKWILFETGRRGHSDLMVVSEDGVSASYLTHGEADCSGAAWSPDGARVSYTERAREHFSGKLKALRFDAELGRAVGAPLDLYTAPNDRGGGWSVGKAAWSPDGKNLAVVLQETGWDKVYLIPSSGGAPQPVTRGEYNDRNPVFSPDGRSLAVVSNRHGFEEENIWIVPLDRTVARRLIDTARPDIETNPRWSPDGKTIYFTRSSPLESSNLLAAPAGGGAQPHYLTHTLPRNLESADFQAPERVQYKGKDGLEIAALLYRPRDSHRGTHYPAVLWIHGGPEGQDTFKWDPWAQYLAQEGYTVLEPNYRGSNGYGEKFRNLNVEDSGGGEMDDVAAGAEYLVAQGLADRARLAIGGGSHGGTMVAYAVTKYPDLFRAAIELYGVVDRATYVERSNRLSAIRWMMKMGGTPQEKPAVYRKADILLDVEKIKAPLLIMHGEDDPQVPPYESAQFVRALKEHGKTYYYFTYPGEGHGFTQPQHRLDAWKKELAFLQKYLQPRYGLSSTSTEDLLLPKDRQERVSGR